MQTFFGENAKKDKMLYKESENVGILHTSFDAKTQWTVKFYYHYLVTNADFITSSAIEANTPKSLPLLSTLSHTKG